MRTAMLTMVLICAVFSINAFAADMLPLKQGIYVPDDRPCKSASNSEIVSYWGGDDSLGSQRTTCKITKMTRKGNVFTIAAKCQDDWTGSEIVGGPTVVTINSQTSFIRDNETYRYSGPKMQF